jgi:hypothetical protein
MNKSIERGTLLQLLIGFGMFVIIIVHAKHCVLINDIFTAGDDNGY